MGADATTISHSGFDARGVSLGIAQLAELHVLRLLDLLLRPVTDEPRAPRHLTVTICPSGIAPMSTSIEAMASVERPDLFDDQRPCDAATPTAPAVPVAR